MKYLALLLLILSIGFSSCKKCITCTKHTVGSRCAACTANGNNFNTCESDLAGGGLTLDEYVSQVRSLGGQCTVTAIADANLEEKLCWQTDNAHNTAVTARAALEARGYTCTE